VFQDILVSGLVNGGVYALLAIGFSLIFGVARIVNIAHTAFYMLASYALYGLLVKAEFPLVVAIPLAIVSVVALSLVCYKLVIEPVRQHESAVLIATIALALIFQESLLVSFGGSFLGIPAAVDGFASILKRRDINAANNVR
jgi:branched-chain amino acid transport system permease protein